MSNKIVEIKSENDAKIIYDLKNFANDTQKERLIQDLANQFFYGFFVVEENVNQDNLDINNIKSYVLFFNSYSSWQNRTIHLADLWFKDNLADEEKYSILKEIKSKLFLFAQNNFLNRVNYHLLETDENKQVIDWFQREGALNLSKLEDWFIYEMDLNVMKNFVAQDFQIPEDFSIIKVTDIKEYCSQIKDLIKEISIFEKMEDQFKSSIPDMIRDYEYLDDKQLNRFYEAMVVLSDKKEVIGYSFYYKTYDLKRGVGSYLEDLYITEKYRRRGLGKALWKKVIEDCLQKFNANFMQWSVLAWNTPAIQLYQKFGAHNCENLSLFRFTTEKIYAQST